MPRTYGTTNAAPYASAPAVGAAGDTYFNTANSTLYLSDGTQWIQVQGSGGASLAGYFYGTYTGGQAVSSGGTTITPWAQVNASGFTVSGSNVTCNQAGRYRVAVQVGGATGATASSYRITNIYQFSSTNAQKALRNLVNPGSAANAYSTWFAEGVFDMVVGDYIQIQLLSDVASTTDNAGRNSIEILPVGGAKGDPGPQGPDVTLVQSSYLFAGILPGAVASGNAGYAGVNTPLRSSGFTVSASTSGQTTQPSVFCNQAGRYRVDVDLTLSNTAINVAGAYFTISLRQYRGTTSIETRDIVASTPWQAWVFARGTAIFDMQVGDQILINTQTDATGRSVDGRSWIEVTPVGGTKGDTGATGPSGGPVPAGGAVNQIITKTGTADFAVGWGNAHGPVISSYSDFNHTDLRTTGIYTVSAGAANGPPGSQPLGICVVSTYGIGVNITQTFQPIGGSGGNAAMWMRTMSGGTWGAWVSVSKQLVLATGINVNGSFSAGGADTNIFTITAAVAGWIEVEMSIVYFGFSGSAAIASAYTMLYTNNLNGSDGAAYQTPSAQLGSVAQGVWARGLPPPPFIIPVTAGNSFTVTFRVGYTPTSTNCYFQCYGSAKLYSNV